MPNRRDFRRSIYFQRLARHASLSSIEENDSQVLLVPGIVNVAGQRGDQAVRAEIEKELGLSVEMNEGRKRRPQNGQRLRLRKHDRVLTPEDTIAVVRRLHGNERLKGRLAPEYGFLTQQKMHPGEDPERGSQTRRRAVRRGPGLGVQVLVIDTGLASSAKSGASWCDASDEDRLIGDAPHLGPAAGHGTFISSLVKLVAPGAEVKNMKVAGPMGFCTEADIVDALLRAKELDPPPQIINLSLGTHGMHAGDDGETLPPIALAEAIHDVFEAFGERVAIVASAGNSASTSPMYPAAYEHVVGVAALESDGRRWPPSNYGPWVTASALGHRLRAEFVNGREDPDYDLDGHAETFSGEAEWSGTSFAAPVVAAQIAITMADQGVPAQRAQEIVLAAGVAPPDPGCGVRVHAAIPGQPTP